MSRSSEEIRNEIEETRERMGERVDAIGYKADVPARSREFVAEKKDALVARVRGATPDAPDVMGGAQRAAGTARENPLGLAVGAAAVGFLVGLAVPSTRVEDEHVGELAEDMKERARDVGQEALDRGKHVVQEVGQAAGQAAMQTARDEGTTQAEAVRDSAGRQLGDVGGR